MERAFNLTESQVDEFTSNVDFPDVDGACWAWRPRRFWFRLGPMRGGRPNEVMWCLMRGLPIPSGHVVVNTCGNEACVNDEHNLPVPLDASPGRPRRDLTGRFLARMTPMPASPDEHWFPLETPPVGPPTTRRRRLRRFGLTLYLNPVKSLRPSRANRFGYFVLLNDAGRQVTSLTAAYEYARGAGSLPSGYAATRTCGVRWCHRHLAPRRLRQHRTARWRINQIHLTYSPEALLPDVFHYPSSGPVPLEDPRLLDSSYEDPVPRAHGPSGPAPSRPPDALILHLRELHDSGRSTYPELVALLGLPLTDESLYFVRDVATRVLYRRVRPPATRPPAASTFEPDGRARPRPDSRAPILPLLTAQVVRRFLGFVPVGPPDDCWPFDGALNAQGYPVFRLSEDRSVGANRVAYVIYRGRESVGRLRHLPLGARLRNCCNPRHWVDPDSTAA